MILIAHRGNTQGPSEKENHPNHIVRAFGLGFDVEVDVWYRNGWYLGHDKPTHETSYSFLQTPGIWVHCKNYEAMKRAVGLHYFYHTTEDYVLTSHGYIWAFPGKPGGERTICVLPFQGQAVNRFAGVCSDWVSKYKANPV